MYSVNECECYDGIFEEDCLFVLLLKEFFAVESFLTTFN